MVSRNVQRNYGITKLDTISACSPKIHTISAIGGKHKGVAFLSTAPGRAMTATWPSEAWNEARFHVAAFAVGRRWVQGAVVYGHAINPETHQTKDATDRICQHVTQRLLEQSSGLRFIAGDFNQSHMGISSMEHWADKGWVNVQWWAFQKFQRLPVSTCKGATIRDHIFVSPELAMYLEDVEVDESFFKDHAIVFAKLASLGQPPMMPLWRHPKQIDWKEVSTLPDHPAVPTASTSMEDRYRQVFQQLEQRVNDQKRAQQQMPLEAKQKGRAATLEVHFVQEFSMPPKPARQGERQPKFHGIDPTYTKWTRQARRLNNFSRLVSNASPSRTQIVHMQKLWKRSLKPQGSPMDFCRGGILQVVIGRF